MNVYLPSDLNDTDNSNVETNTYIIRTALERFADYLESHKTNLDQAFESKVN